MGGRTQREGHRKQVAWKKSGNNLPRQKTQEHLEAHKEELGIRGSPGCKPGH